MRQGEHGEEYVVAWAEETADGRDIVITKVDIDNLLRAKAAIYAGFSSLAQAVGVELEMVEELLIGGSFRPAHQRGKGRGDWPAARPVVGRKRASGGR